MKITTFGSMPMLDKGRIKPIETYARVHLMAINNKQEYKDELGNSGQPAVRWLLNLLAYGLVRFELSEPIPISDPQVRDWLGLTEHPGQTFFRPNEVIAAFRNNQDKLRQVFEQSADKRKPLDNKIVELASQVIERQEATKKITKVFDKQGNPLKAPVFRIENDQVLNMLELKPREGLRYAQSEIENPDSPAFQQFVQKAVQASKLKAPDLVDRKVMELYQHLMIQEEVGSLNVTIVPPQPGKEDWLTVNEALTKNEAKNNPAAQTLENLLQAYKRGDVAEFNKNVDRYKQQMTEMMPNDVRMARLEAWLNSASPFYRCPALYVLVFLLACLSWTGAASELFRRSAFWLAVTVVAVHTIGLFLRMYIQGRPPVLNLYSSAVFIGWLGVLLCLAIEKLQWNGIGSCVAAVVGFATLIVALHLGVSGDTLEVPSAVLDTNFWLATHVTTVTFGYTATFVAGFLAIVYLWFMLATTVVAFFRNRGQKEWSNPLMFCLAMFGVVAVPAMMLVLLPGGLCYVYMPDDAEMTFVTAGLFIVFAAGVYSVMVALNWFSAPPQAAGKGEVPGIARWMENLTLSPEKAKGLSNVIYGVICFATMLSFIGTVLGGIWADQSWGRFWGWDPKENGAVLIVIMNALILHARWGGMIKERGLVTLAIVGNMVTMWSWFGTNQLGVGLHSYGVNKTLVTMCTCFWASQLLLIGVSLLPLKYWRSYAKLTAPLVPKPVETKLPLRPGKRSSTGVLPA